MVPLSGTVEAEVTRWARARLERILRPSPRLSYRDLNLRVGFWRLDRVRSFALFPQTAHVETVLRMSRM
ncbi:MAG: hypothetical protein ACREK5_07210 [Gemmatimonadota bacterium]